MQLFLEGKSIELYVCARGIQGESWCETDQTRLRFIAWVRSLLPSRGSACPHDLKLRQPQRVTCRAVGGNEAIPQAIHRSESSF